MSAWSKKQQDRHDNFVDALNADKEIFKKKRNFSFGKGMFLSALGGMGLIMGGSLMMNTYNSAYIINNRVNGFEILGGNNKPIGSDAEQIFMKNDVKVLHPKLQEELKPELVEAYKDGNISFKEKDALLAKIESLKMKHYGTTTPREGALLLSEKNKIKP
jgi:hypothetical protein